jgi:hypothetical protein
LDNFITGLLVETSLLTLTFNSVFAVVLLIVCDAISSLSKLVGSLAFVKVGILSIARVSLVILFADRLGILSTPNVSLVILFADRLGILPPVSVGIGILSAVNVGILATANSPLAILSAVRGGILAMVRVGILSTPSVPLLILAASRFGIIVADISLVSRALSTLPLLAKSLKYH